MKTLIKIKLIALFILSATFTHAASIGVGPIKTFGLYAPAETATTIARLELIKLNKYQVLDRFDMKEAVGKDRYNDCYGKTCLIEYGKELKVDFMLSGNIDALGGKIVITLKLIDIDEEKVVKTQTAEFDNQEAELQRMIGIVIQEMHGLTPDPLLKKQLSFRNEVITSNNVGRVKNSGPRMGMAYTVGTLNEFATRPEEYGGLEISPFVSNLGYQFERQYVGTEKFSALLEGMINFTALEQGKLIPSFSVLNGFRFGKQGWEFAFGPSFGFSKTSVGFWTDESKDLLGETSARYWTESEFNASEFSENKLTDYGYSYTRNLDSRGRLDFNTRWIMAFGRTYRSGALNIPVNVFYSSQKGGGMAGFSVGFNITREKSKVR